MPRLLHASFFALAVISLTGCGFALRGTDNAVQLAPAYQMVALTTDDTPDAVALKQPLIRHLQMRGVSTAHDTNTQIDIKNVRFRRYELVGTLTEVRLVLMADAHYHINGQVYTYPLQVEQSYQHNEASVVITDAKGDTAKTWLYDNLAERIAEQYRAIAQKTQVQ